MTEYIQVLTTVDKEEDAKRIAQMVLEKAKCLTESGHDVVVLLDSITRLARAYNTVAPASGKVLTGGIDANALQKPKRSAKRSPPCVMAPGARHEG